MNATRTVKKAKPAASKAAAKKAAKSAVRPAEKVAARKPAASRPAPKKPAAKAAASSRKPAAKPLAPMTYTTLETMTAHGVGQIWLNRPDVRNAMNDVMFRELGHAVQSAIENPAVRVILLAGRGTAFCAGGDLNWMKTARNMTPAQAREDSVALAKVLRKMYESPKPIVARVHGSAFAGGMGLVAASDITVASIETKFCLSETKLGLIPAMISPYVIKAMGEANARRYMLTAEVFEAAEAYRIGFIREIAPLEELDAKVNEILGYLIKASPNALNETKALIRAVSERPIDDAVMNDTAARIARVRATDDAQEGIAAFFEKRLPSWVPKMESR